MKKIALIFAIAVMFFCSSCTKNKTQLQNSIYIEDKENPGLPMATELGHNYFGAYYYINAGEKQILKGTGTRIVDTLNSITVELIGTSSPNVTFVVTKSSELTDIYSLNGKKIDLTKSEICGVKFLGDSIVNVNEGTLKFNRVNHVYYNDALQDGWVLLCGEFYFNGTFGSNSAVKVEKGRFDMIYGQK